jgi:hypothetical protein
VTAEPVVSAATGDDVHKYEAAVEQPAGAVEPLGELPRSYGEDFLFLVARDPRWLFTYWDVDWSAHAHSKMRDGKLFLKVTCADGGEVSLIEINPEARNWYVPVSKPGAIYEAEIGYFTRQRGNWKAVVTADPAATPSEQVSEETEAAFATVPMHLTFQHMMEMVHEERRDGESLASTLARLQDEGRRLISGRLPEWTEEQRRILALLIGRELFSREGMSSAEFAEMLRKHLAENLSSETASALLAKGEFWGPGVASLFSGIGAAGAGGSEVTSFFSALGAVSSGQLMSWFGALGGLSSAQLSSMFGAFGASASEVSSRFGAFGASSSEVSSQFGAFGAWSSEVTSMFAAPGASWSGQPFGAPAERGFFMHVNAEVIFYGGTHPDAKVWIDGREVKLQPDGSFRYHFKFPDGDYEIPIVAQSPDGRELRTASLNFRRLTARKGGVGHTAQPAHLGTPMGRKSA